MIVNSPNLLHNQIVKNALDMDSRLRVARGIAKTETLASVIVFETLKGRGHPAEPPPLISDGWGGIDDALIEGYGLVPEYCRRGRPPTRLAIPANGQAAG